MLSKAKSKYVSCLISRSITRVRGSGNIPAAATSRVAYPENEFLKLEKN